MHIIDYLKFVAVGVICLPTAIVMSAIEPEVDIPQAWAEATDSLYSSAPCSDNWWTLFDDPTIDSLVDMALSNNYDVSMAMRRVEIARQSVGTAQAAYYPTIGLSGNYDYGQTSGLTYGRHGSATRNGYFNAGVNLSWEIDLFGKITAQTRVAKEQVRVSAAQRAGVDLSVAAQMVQSYITLRVHQAQMQVAKDHSASQYSALHIAEVRFDTGLASMMDVDQAQQVYYSTIASIPNLQAMITADMNAIAVLAGTSTTNIEPLLAANAGRLPEYLHLVQTGTPTELLTRRPDVAEAERQVAVEAANLGLARKDWLPSLSVNASAGTTAHNAGDLFKRESFGYSVAPTLSWTVFDGMLRTHNIRSAGLQVKNAVDNYNLTILTAVNEVDNAIAAYNGAIHYITALDDVVKATKNYDTRALDNYKNGLSPYINVANAQMSFLEAVNNLIVAKGNALGDLVTLYKALGGGWNGN